MIDDGDDEPLNGEIIEPGRALIPDRVTAPHRRDFSKGLSVKAKLALELMAHGSSDLDLCAKMGIAPGVPFELPQAARACSFQQRYVRAIIASPEGQREQERLLAELKSGAKFTAQHKINELVTEPGENSAADRTVQLKAASLNLDLSGGNGGGGARLGVQVNVHGGRGGYGPGVKLNAFGQPVGEVPGYLIELSIDRGANRDMRERTAKEIRKWPADSESGGFRYPDAGHVEGEKPWHLALVVYPDGHEEAAYRPERKASDEEKAAGCLVVFIDPRVGAAP